MKKWKRLSALLTVFAIAGSMGLQSAVFAETETEAVKDWNYYATLDDYSVYCDYCDTYGYAMQDELPSIGELPNFRALRWGSTGATLVNAGFQFILENQFPNEKYYDVRYNMNYFGFPKEWCNIEEQNKEYYHVGSIDILNYGGSIYMQLHETEFTKNLTDNVINAYRIVLTVQNSEFGKEYPIVFADISKPMDNDNSTQIKKDWNYYASLDNYSVYCDYCNTYGYEIKEKLPSRKELPHYDMLHNYGAFLANTTIYAAIEVSDIPYEEWSNRHFTNEKLSEVLANQGATYFGFPADWYGKNNDGSDPLDIQTMGGIVEFSTTPTPQTKNLLDNIINAYRIELTIRNSDFGKEYPISNITLPRVSEETPRLATGDIDGNSEVSIIDALALNQYLLGIREIADEAVICADVDGNGIVNDADAMNILKYLVGLVDFAAPQSQS